METDNGKVDAALVVDAKGAVSEGVMTYDKATEILDASPEIDLKAVQGNRPDLRRKLMATINNVRGDDNPTATSILTQAIADGDLVLDKALNKWVVAP